VYTGPWEALNYFSYQPGEAYLDAAGTGQLSATASVVQCVSFFVCSTVQLEVENWERNNYALFVLASSVLVHNLLKD
jgi:hypothetical protein